MLGGEFPYQFGARKRQTLRRGHTKTREIKMRWIQDRQIRRRLVHGIKATGYLCALLLCGCDVRGCMYKRTTTTEVRYHENGQRLEEKFNYSTDDRDGYSIAVWTDASIFFTPSGVDVHIEVTCPA